jgi:hypothetical protein
MGGRILLFKVSKMGRGTGAKWQTEEENYIHRSAMRVAFDVSSNVIRPFSPCKNLIRIDVKRPKSGTIPGHEELGK